MKKIFVLVIIFSLFLFALASCTDINKDQENIDDTDTGIEREDMETEVIYEGSSEILEIESFDGYMLKGKLTIPKGAKNVPKLVIYVNGSGANTYDNRRTTGEERFNYFDFFADEFSNRGIAFFSYNTRGVDISNNPPMYNDIDEEAYQSYLPLNSVEDVYYMINSIKQNERLKDCKVYLLGWSEGTIIAPLVAEKYSDIVDGLFLAGYANKNMKDILIWQNSGGSSYAWFSGNFETDDRGRISRESFEADPNGMIATELQNSPFEVFDVNNDGYIDEEDCIMRVTAIMGDYLNEIFAAIERRDDEWLKNNYGTVNGVSLIPLTSAWFLEHFSLRNNTDILPDLSLPIYIFHGTLDLNVDVREVYKINEKFQELGKSNLTINVFDNHNHDLNFMEFISNNNISVGMQAIFEAVSDME